MTRAKFLDPKFWPFVERPNKIFDRIAAHDPFGPWTVSVFDPYSGRLIGRGTFRANDPAAMHRWLLQIQSRCERVQWFVE